MLPIVKLDFENVYVRTWMSLGNKNYWYDSHIAASFIWYMLALLTKKQSYSSFSETAGVFLLLDLI